MNTSTKTYSNKSNAIRAAKAAMVKLGVEKPTLNVDFVLSEEAGRFAWAPKQVEAVKKEVQVKPEVKKGSIASTVGAWMKQGATLSGKEPEVKAKKREALPKKNGYTHPASTSMTCRIWDFCDNLVREDDLPNNKAVLAFAEENNLNPNMAKSQFSWWRRFHGIVNGLKSREQLDEWKEFHGVA